jgi:hypothetical protein
MNAITERCRQAGIRLWAEGGTLRYDVPKGAMTPALVAEIKLHKTEILRLLAPSLPLCTAVGAAIPGVSYEFAARLSPEDWEDLAAGDITAEQVQAFEKASIERRRPDLYPPLAPVQELRRQRVLAARDGARYAMLVEDPNTDPVVMALATPDGTCEVLIPKDRYDPFAVLAMMEAWEA